MLSDRLAQQIWLQCSRPHWNDMNYTFTSCSQAVLLWERSCITLSVKVLQCSAIKLSFYLFDFFFFLHCLWLCWSFLFVFICLCCFMLSWLVTVWGSGLICYRIGWMKVLFLMLLMNPWHVQSGVGRLSWLSLIVLLFLWVSDINVSVYLSFFFFFCSFKPLLATCCRNKWNVSRRIYSKQHSVGAGQVCAEGLFQNFSVKQGNSRLIKEVD